MQHGFGRAFEQVRHADEKLSLAQADGVVNRDECVEADVHRRNRRARAQFAVGLLEDFCEPGGHVESRVARRQSPAASCRLPVNRGGFQGDCLAFFLRFTYCSTSVTVLRWSSALESTVSMALLRRNSYCLASAASALAASFRARSLDWNSM